MIERRGSTRQKSFLRGCIYFNNRRSAVDCLIRDISNDGARLLFSDAVSIPDVIELYIPQKEQTLRALVQRRHGAEVGIKFANETRSTDKPADPDVAGLSERVQKLEAEVIALRKMLKRLKSDASDSDAA